MARNNGRDRDQQGDASAVAFLACPKTYELRRVARIPCRRLNPERLAQEKGFVGMKDTAIFFL
jgi:hypothetical protein